MPHPEPLDHARLSRLLGGEALADLRQRLRKRYQRCTTPEDSFTLTRLTSTERDALAGLLGRRRSTAASLRLSHQAIDNTLRQAGLAPDLRTALECLDGAITDTAAQREHRHRVWTEVFARLSGGPLANALTRPVEQGLVKRLARHDARIAKDMLAQAQRVIEHLPATGITRSRLAADLLGDAHGLDPSRPVATLLRRALDPDRLLTRWREVWAGQGVMVSELAKPVAVLNLRTEGADPVDRLLETARQAGEPLHLSLRQLLRMPPQWQREQPIYICENPDILAAAADALSTACLPMVSLDGQLSAAPRTLLDQLHAAGCPLYYHGDFDWPGLAIGNGIVKRYAAKPWRFSAADYAPRQGIELQGEPVAALWDDGLAAKMRAMGLAVHEEAQLSILLQDLAVGLKA